ncbi:Zinc finger C-x8-C-x5-C-x3-H type family protein [Dorcoceras hygrometricum]|uniref:Zinc finger C-x8-C-x5-C-x3-H type family protein n=1 Tax=Dorcoceras hygrometricum TaxID=472368 RepID=A0A2Z7AII3_9LAMI|nr:Zinc finger C-x8-C-x5-C-x3-H type family protein [Dorcoceras hygrometricum]
MMIHGRANMYVPAWASTAASADPTTFPMSLTAREGSSLSDEYHDTLSALQRYLPSNSNDAGFPEMEGFPVDTHSCDQFRMFEFKVRRCTRGRSHDWTECPFAHPGEKARRRDPRKFHYSSAACPEFRKGSCRRGDACEFAHGVFECWLHPERYRTLPCKDGMNCKRRVCFFAHCPDQLRVLNPLADSYDSASPPMGSPPLTPMDISVNDMMASMRQLQLSKVKSMPHSWRTHLTRPGGNFILPTTQTGVLARPGIRYFEAWEDAVPVMETVQSGRDLRAKMMEKLSLENPLQLNPNPDVGWVSDLLK